MTQPRKRVEDIVVCTMLEDLPKMERRFPWVRLKLQLCEVAMRKQRRLTSLDSLIDQLFKQLRSALRGRFERSLGAITKLLQTVYA